MPELSTEHVTHHVVRLTTYELESLREAARIALDSTDGTCVHTKDWQAFVRLGKGPTRGSRTPTDVDVVCADPRTRAALTRASQGLDEGLPRRS